MAYWTHRLKIFYFNILFYSLYSYLIQTNIRYLLIIKNCSDVHQQARNFHVWLQTRIQYLCQGQMHRRQWMSSGKIIKHSNNQPSRIIFFCFIYSVIFPFLRVSSPFDSLDWGITQVRGTASYSNERLVDLTISPCAADHGRVSAIGVVRVCCADILWNMKTFIKINEQYESNQNNYERPNGTDNNISIM